MKESFASFIRGKRIAAGFTQQECANALGLDHRATFLKKEKGLWEFSFLDVVNFAKLLGVPASVLIAEWEGEIKTNEY